MKKLTTALILICVLAISVTQSVSADFGPKASLKITILGLEKDTYKVDVLSEEMLGSNTINEPIENLQWYSYFDEYPEELVGFGYHGLFSYTLYNGIGSIRQTDNKQLTQEYQLNYHPPQTFRIVVVTNDGTIIISDLITRIAFDTVLEWDLREVSTTSFSVDEGKISGNIGIGYEDNYTVSPKFIWTSVWRTIYRVVITLIIEIGILFLFKYRQRETYIKVGIANLITQITLSALVIVSTNGIGILGAIASLLFLEIFVFTAEIIYYSIYLKEKTPGMAAIYAVVANTASLIIGFFVVIYT